MKERISPLGIGEMTVRVRRRETGKAHKNVAALSFQSKTEKARDGFKFIEEYQGICQLC